MVQLRIGHFSGFLATIRLVAFHLVYDGSFDLTNGVTIGFGLVICPRSSIMSPMQESIGGFGQLPVYPQLS